MSRRHDSKQDDLSNSPKEQTPPPAGGISFSMWAGGILLLAGIGLWFAPSIVAMTELRHQILGAALPDYPGRMEVGSASLGWFSPAVLQDIQIFDLQGEPLVSVGAVTTESTLASLALDRVHLGKITVDKPKLRIVARKDGSNLEDSLAKLLPQSGDPSTATAPELSLAVSGGEFEIIDAASKQSWKWREIKGEVTPPHGAEPVLRAQLEAIGGEAKAESPLTAKVTFQPPERKSSFGKGMIELQSAQLPLAPVQLIAARFVSDLQLAGRFAPELKLAWSDAAEGGAAWRATGKLSASDLAAAAPSLVGADTFRISRLETQFDATLIGDRLKVADLILQSDIASARGSGSTRLDPSSSSRLIASILESLRGEDCRVDGRVDLARLAALLPDTLRLRPGTQITGGQLEVVLASSGASGKRRLEGRLEATDLTALDAGRTLRWEQPMQVQLVALDGKDGPTIESLTCKSEFLAAEMKGTIQNGWVEVKADLDRLAREVSKVADLGATQMAGRVDGRIVWSGEGDAVTAGGKLQIDGLNLSLPGRRPWIEQQLVAEAKATAKADAQGLHRLDAFQAALVSGNDRLDVKLLRPMTEVSATARWPLSVALQGDLATWQPRSEIVVAASGWNIGGQVKLDAKGEFSPADSTVESATLDLAKFIVQGATGAIDEPQLHLETSGAWNTAQRQFASPLTTLVTTSLSLRAEKLQFALPADGKPQAVGDIAFRGDLARLSRYISIAGQAPSWAAAGQLTGGARLTQKADTVTAVWNATVDNAALYFQQVTPPLGDTVFRPANRPAAAWQEVWSEKQVVFEGQGTYQGDQDLAQLDQFSIGGAGLAIRAKGQTQKLRSSPSVNLEGNLDYDLAQLADRFRGLIGPVKIAGRESKPFKLSGPLLPGAGATTGATPVGAVANTPLLASDLKGEFGLGWQQIEVLGLKVGPGALDAKLAESQIDVPPLNIAIEDGRLVAAPRVFLYSPQPTLAVGQGRVLENVRLSPELCRAWMKYVTPLLADVTQIDGRFSVDLVGGQVPLTDPLRLGAQGVIEVREITAGPGPAAQPLVNLTRQLKALLDKKQLLGLGQSQPTWIHLPAQKIEFQVVDGRVYHRNLLMKVGDITMRSTGSVGLDQSLDLTSEVPVLDGWIDKEKAFAPLRGQMLKIPIRGTLSAPKFDLKVLKELGGLVTGGLLDKFLGPQKP